MITVIIPVYKNYEMFLNNLKTNNKFFNGCEIVVMNDFPQEKITDRVKEIIPQAIVIDNDVNLGFSLNVNQGVRLANSEYVFLLNSDVILKDNSFKKSMDEFKKDSELFALSFAQYESNGKLVGANRGYFKDGLIYHSSRLNSKSDTITSNFWAEGGSSIFKKNLFLELGGFDYLYSPFYWEDIDLSYRAKKMGFKVLYFPTVKVEHQHKSTIGKYFQKKDILKTAYRNQFIFNWKNLTDSNLIIKHLLYMPILLISSLINGNWNLLQGFLLALIRLPAIINSRNKAVKLFIKSDQEILNQFK